MNNLYKANFGTLIKQLMLLSAMIIIFSSISLQAQWVNLTDGLTNTNINALFSVVDTVYAGTDDGVFKIYDNTTTWVDVSGNIGNRHVNDLRGGGSAQTLWAATADGAYLNPLGANWENNTGTGLSSTDMNYYWFGGWDNAMIGTNGSGVYHSEELNGPWSAANNGVSGAGMIVNDISGYKDNDLEFAVMATDGGVYIATDSLLTWSAVNNGLTGDALLVKKVMALGTTIMIATRNGFFVSVDFGQNWLPSIPNEKFNTLGFDLFYTGTLYMFGEKGFATADFVNINEIDLTGVTNEVSSFAVTPDFLYIGTNDGTGRSNGGIFKKTHEQVLAIAEDTPQLPQTLELRQNYPNPFNPSTTISYSIKQAGFVSLIVYDVLGQKVKSLVNTQKPVGEYKINFSADGLESGIYFYQLQVGNHQSATKKMILIK